jgi:hypothetical protein
MGEGGLFGPGTMPAQKDSVIMPIHWSLARTPATSNGIMYSSCSDMSIVPNKASAIVPVLGCPLARHLTGQIKSRRFVSCLFLSCPHTNQTTPVGWFDSPKQRSNERVGQVASVLTHSSSVAAVRSLSHHRERVMSRRSLWSLFGPVASRHTDAWTPPRRPLRQSIQSSPFAEYMFWAGRMFCSGADIAIFERTN